MISEKEQELIDAGFFLRNDTEDRKEWDDVKSGETSAEAYSLCKISNDIYPFQRVEVFVGSKNWAVDMAYQRLQEGIKLIKL